MEKIICTKCGAENTSKSKYCTSCGYELPKIQIENLNSNTQPLISSKSDNKKKLVPTIVGVIVFLIVYYGVQQFFFKSASLDKNMIISQVKLIKLAR